VGSDSGFTEEFGNQSRRLKEFRASIPGTINRSLTNDELPPSIRRTINEFRQAQSQGRDRNADIIRGGGRGQDSGQVFDRALDLGNLNIPSLKFSEERSQQILEQDGNTADIQFLRDRAQDLFRLDPQLTEASEAGLDIIRAGGRTRENTRALSSFQDIVDSGGFTPELSGILGNVQSQIAKGGLTDEARRLLEPLIDTVENRGRGGALLPFEDVVGFARDQSISRTRQGAEAARRSALQRGGGGAGIISSGLQNQALAEFADESIRNEASAVQQAAVQQQQLQLQQFLGAAQAGSSITGAATQLLGQLNAVQGDLARTASQNLATGERGVSNTLNNILGNLNSGQNIFNEAKARELDRNKLGADLGLGVEDLVNRRVQGANANLLGLGNLRLGGLNLAGSLGQGFDARVDASLDRGVQQNQLDLGLLGQQGNLRAQTLTQIINGLGLETDILGQQGQLAIEGGRNVASGAQILAGIFSSIINAIPAFTGQRTQTAIGGGAQGQGGFAQQAGGGLGGFLQTLEQIIGAGGSSPGRFTPAAQPPGVAPPNVALPTGGVPQIAVSQGATPGIAAPRGPQSLDIDSFNRSGFGETLRNNILGGGRGRLA